MARLWVCVQESDSLSLRDMSDSEVRLVFCRVGASFVACVQESFVLAVRGEGAGEDKEEALFGHK